MITSTENNISVVSEKECCGCLVCEKVCPKNCISGVEGVYGFQFPKIDSQKCINCGMCLSSCPIVTIKKNDIDKQSVYSAEASENKVRQRGSSGGMFELLATEFLKNGGVVYGAVCDKNLKVHHERAANTDELLPLLKSKYVQSDITEIYEPIANDIRSGKQVLFSGTPCQCMAIRNFLKDDKNLFLIDIVCRGVPSQKVFDTFIKYEEEKIHRKIDSFMFRYKPPRNPEIHFFQYTASGKKKTGGFWEFPFYYAYKKYLLAREGCYTCKYATIDRVSDISLADFWNIGKYDKKADVGEGISLVLVNTDKGGVLFGNISDKIRQKEYSGDVAKSCNACLRKPTTKPKDYEAFRYDFEHLPMKELEEKYLKNNIFLKKVYRTIPKCIRKHLPWKV